MGTEGRYPVGRLALCRVYQKGRRSTTAPLWVMVAASSHMPLYSLVESTQRVYGVRLFFVSARTNKRHHHHHNRQVRARARGLLSRGEEEGQTFERTFRGTSRYESGGLRKYLLKFCMNACLSCHATSPQISWQHPVLCTLTKRS